MFQRWEVRQVQMRRCPSTSYSQVLIIWGIDDHFMLKPITCSALCCEDKRENSSLHLLVTCHGPGILVIIPILQVRKWAQHHTANKCSNIIIFLFAVFITPINKLPPPSVSLLSTLPSMVKHPHLPTTIYKRIDVFSYVTLHFSR